MLTARQVSAPSAMEAASAQFVAGAMSRLPGALTESGVSALPGVLSVRRPNMLGPIPRRGRSTPKVAEPRHEPRAQHAVALARSAKPGPRAKPVTSLIRMRPTSHPRRDTSRPICPKRSPPHPKQPIFTSSHQSGRRFEQQPDGSPPTQRPNRGFCYHRPPTRRRHAVRSLLWSQFPPLARLDPPQTRPHRQKHPQHWTPPHPTCPQRSPPRLQQPIFTSSHQSGRRFEHQPEVVSFVVV